jgi:hypothetical protein
MNRRTIVAAVIALACGCTKALPVDESYDGDEARDLLVTVLDAWKTKRLGSLAEHKPPIRFADDDERAGSQLIEYEFIEPDKTVKPFVNVEMMLTLKNSAGKRQTIPASYQVSLAPAPAVLRSDP